MSSTQNESETTGNPIMEVVGVDAGSDTGEKSEPKVINSDSVRVKRARGRPRKYEVGENKPFLVSASVSVSESPVFVESEVKRGRGRPRGSGKLQILASIGGCVAETAGGSMTPHVLIVNPGEDVVGKIFSFFMKGPKGAVCILSAAGSVSTVILRQPGVSGGSLRYEGHFQILSLSGSCTFTSSVAGGDERKIGTLSVSLAKPDGVVFGGGVESSLIAATPIQLILATFKQNISNQIKRKYSSPNMVTNQDSSSDNNLKVPRVIVEGEPSCLRATATKKANGVGETDDNVKGERTTNGVSESENITNVQSDSVGDGVIDLES